MESHLVFCSEVEGLTNALEITHDPKQWILFIDSWKLGLKSQWKPSSIYCSSAWCPFEREIHAYVNWKQLLNTIEYKKYRWYICIELKVHAFLMGLHQGYTNDIQNTCASCVSGT